MKMNWDKLLELADRIGKAGLGVELLLGALYLFCAFMGAILKAAGVG